jgi:hypothetical protein
MALRLATRPRAYPPLPSLPAVSSRRPAARAGGRAGPREGVALPRVGSVRSSGQCAQIVHTSWLRASRLAAASGDAWLVFEFLEHAGVVLGKRRDAVSGLTSDETPAPGLTAERRWRDNAAGPNEVFSVSFAPA